MVFYPCLLLASFYPTFFLLVGIYFCFIKNMESKKSANISLTVMKVQGDFLCVLMMKWANLLSIIYIMKAPRFIAKRLHEENSRLRRCHVWNVIFRMCLAIHYPYS